MKCYSIAISQRKLGECGIGPNMEIARGFAIQSNIEFFYLKPENDCRTILSKKTVSQSLFIIEGVTLINNSIN